MKQSNTHYESKEFLYRNVPYDKGWYFYDEERDLYGPFMTKTQAEVAFRIYLQQLMDGVSPTQINNVPNLSKH